MLIIERVRAKKASMRNNPAEARANQELAVAAMFAGIGSDEWETYMRQFIDPGNQAQLSRLTVPDSAPGGTPSDMDIRRAYIVSNAICGSQTVSGFDKFVWTIDDGLPGGPGAPVDPNGDCEGETATAKQDARLSRM